MGYLKIPNLYSDNRIMAFKEVYVTEKIHGTSAHVSWNEGSLRFFSGGSSHERFVELFDAEFLTAKFEEKFGSNSKVVVYGEAFGGKCQGMSKVYGTDLQFRAFDAKIDDSWLSVPDAAVLAEQLGLRFVEFHLVAANLLYLNRWRDYPSAVGLELTGNEMPREGVVIHPPFEVTLNNGRRLIAKHKSESFEERTSKPKVGVDRAVLSAAQAIADEWVTHRRGEHVVDQLRSRDIPIQIESTKEFIRSMVADIKEESDGEIEWSKPAERAISSTAAKVFKKLLQGEQAEA